MIRAALIGVTVGVTAALASFVPGLRGPTPFERAWVRPQFRSHR